MKTAEKNQTSINEEMRDYRANLPACPDVIKNFLKKATHREKLFAVLLSQLLNKESAFGGEDHLIGNNSYNKWLPEIIKTGKNPDYVKTCKDIDEITITHMIPILDAWEV